MTWLSKKKRSWRRYELLTWKDYEYVYFIFKAYTRSEYIAILLADISHAIKSQSVISEVTKDFYELLNYGKTSKILNNK